MKRWQKRSLAILCCFSMVFLAAGLFAGNFFYNLALNPHADKSSVTESEANQISFDLGALERGSDWLTEQGYSGVEITSHDGLRLQGYSIPNNDDPNGPWVILSHGYMGHARQLGYYAQNFYELGYSVLLVDARGHGLSEGSYYGMGVHDRLDLVGWVGALNEWQDTPDVVLFGVSMGGAAVMMAAGEDLPGNVLAIVEDCGYSSVKEEFRYQLKLLFNLPAFPILNFADLVTQVRAGFSFSETPALQQVAASTTPILFIHGEEDTFIPVSMVYELYEACAADKELLVVPGAGHGGAATTDPDTYWLAVETFLNRYIPR